MLEITTENSNQEIKRWDEVYVLKNENEWEYTHSSGNTGLEDPSQFVERWVEPVLVVAKLATEYEFIKDELILLSSDRGEYSVTVRVTEEAVVDCRLYYEGNERVDHNSPWMPLELIAPYIASSSNHFILNDYGFIIGFKTLAEAKVALAEETARSEEYSQEDSEYPMCNWYLY